MSEQPTKQPCPFCRAAGDDRLYDLWDRFDAGHIAHVHCTHCGADGPSKYSEASHHDAIRQARRAWNRRTPDLTHPRRTDMSTLCENLLHKAVCQAVALLNTAPDVVRITEGRKARDILRQALADYADAYMNEPAPEAERVAVARKHQTRRPTPTKD